VTEPSRDHDHIVVLESATWADFQRLLEMRGDRSVPRLAYADGRLEIMTPSRSHESIKSMIGRLVEAWCMERGVDITPYGSWTLEDKHVARGVEPDECYVLGTAEEPDRPDLAIEVNVHAGSVIDGRTTSPRSRNLASAPAAAAGCLAPPSPP